MNKKILFFNVLCLVGLIVVVTIFSLYQIFVTIDYQKISFSQFFSPRKFIDATKQVGFKVPTFASEKMKVVDAGIGNVFEIEGIQYLVSLSEENTLMVSNLKSEETKNIALDPTAHYEVITLLNPQTIILATKKTNWQLLSFNLESTTSEVLSDQISFQGDRLSLTSSPRQNHIAFSDCTPFCEVVVFDLAQKKEVRRFPAFTDADKKPSSTDFSLDFFDPEKGLLGYHSMSGSQLYVIDYDLNLLQDIRLDNERNSAEFIGYFPGSQQLLFRLKEKNGAYDQLALYAANRPSLHLLQKVQPTDSVLILSEANGYSVGNKVFDLAGTQLDSIQIEKYKKALTVY